MKKPNFAKLGVFLILGSIVFIADRSQRSVIKDQERIIAELRVLHSSYRSTFSREEKERISRKALDLIDGNTELRLPNDLNQFVVVTLTVPIE
jgi:uncharacterized protein YbbC (DUF1343 family)